jgi:hypothetical protein
MATIPAIRPCDFCTITAVCNKRGSMEKLAVDNKLVSLTFPCPELNPKHKVLYSIEHVLQLGVNMGSVTKARFDVLCYGLSAIMTGALILWVALVK